MKKLLGIVVLCLLFGVNAYADNHCNDERKEWVKWIKKAISIELDSPKFSNNQCWAEVVSYKKIKLNLNLNNIKKNSDKTKVTSEGVSEVLDSSSFDINFDDINYVPEDFKKETEVIKTYLAEVLK